MNQVGHEGDLGDGAPPVPGEEVVDDASEPAAAGKDEPGEAETPHHVTASVPEPCDRLVRVHPVKVSVIGCVDQSEEKEEHALPDHKVDHRWDVDLLSSGDVKEMSQEKTHYVALVSSSINCEILTLNNVHPAGNVSRRPVGILKSAPKAPSN